MNKPEYLVTLDEREVFPSGFALEAGTYIVERSNAGEFLFQSRKAKIDRLAGIPKGDGSDSILIVRPGGFGDLLFCTPLARAAKAQGLRVGVACMKKFAPILEHNPDIDEIVPYPVSLSEWDRWGRHVWLERILEDGVDGVSETMTECAIDLIAKCAGIEISDKAMRYVVTEDEDWWAMEKYPKHGKPRVGIQLVASAANRSYPWHHLQVLAGLLAHEGCEVFLFGPPGLISGVDGPFVNLTADNLTFRQSCAVLGTCDAVVAPDSSLCHVAGALGIPTVALYGPFLSQTRVKYAESVKPINGKAPCAPCFHHDYPGIPWPEGCPGRKTGRCEALANIPPALVSATVMHEIAKAKEVEAVA